MIFSEIKVGDYIHRSPKGISYKRTMTVVVSKEGGISKGSITFVNARTGEMTTIPSEQFDKANFDYISPEMVAREFGND